MTRRAATQLHPLPTPQPSPLDRARYRVGQFWQGLGASISPAERREVARLLPEPAYALFEQMPRDAQRHSLNVLRRVREAGYSQPDLAAAALLHDVGKCADGRLGLWLRGPLVLLEAFAPHLLHRWATSEPQPGWIGSVRRLFYVHLEHPRLGAEMAAACGCSGRACRLIAYHQERGPIPSLSREETEWLSVLQWADEHS
jgi:hypothetical protein